MDTLTGLTITSASVDQIQESLKAIGDDLKDMTDAQGDSPPDRKQQVETATTTFGSQVATIAQQVLSGLSGSDAKAQAESAVDDLAASYKQALAPIDCGWRRRRDGAGRHAEEMAAQVKLHSKQLFVFGFDCERRVRRPAGRGAREARERRCCANPGGGVRRSRRGHRETPWRLTFWEVPAGSSQSCSISGWTRPRDARRPSGLLARARATAWRRMLRDLGRALGVLRWRQCLSSTLWARALEDAVARVSGRTLASEFVEAARLSELPPDLLRKLL